jgi:small-conductance mechanosensitive channel
VLAFVLRFAIVFLLGIVARLTSKTKSTLDDEIIEKIKLPANLFAIITSAYITINYVDPAFVVSGITPLEVYSLLLILVIALTLDRLLLAISGWYLREVAPKTKSHLDEEVVPMIRKLVRILLYTITLLILLNRLGVDVTALIATLGIAGLAIALALQDTLSNFFSGIYLMADRPLREGDYISVPNEKIEGKVEKIGWRTTKIRMLANNDVYIPNAKLAQSVIVNYYTPSPELGQNIVVGVSYNEDVDTVLKVMQEAVNNVVKSSENSSKTFEPIVRFEEFADSALQFKITVRAKNFESQPILISEIKRELFYAFKRNKIRVPFPTRNVHLFQERKNK